MTRWFYSTQVRCLDSRSTARFCVFENVMVVPYRHRPDTLILSLSVQLDFTKMHDVRREGRSTDTRRWGGVGREIVVTKCRCRHPYIYPSDIDDIITVASPAVWYGEPLLTVSFGYRGSVLPSFVIFRIPAWSDRIYFLTLISNVLRSWDKGFLSADCWRKDKPRDIGYFPVR